MIILSSIWLSPAFNAFTEKKIAEGFFFKWKIKVTYNEYYEEFKHNRQYSHDYRKQH